MLGRGAVTRPDLIVQVDKIDVANDESLITSTLLWSDLITHQIKFLQGEAKNDVVLVGRYKQWLGMLTKGYMEAGSTPQFKLLQDGELIDLEGDIPSWENNQLYMVSSLTEAIPLPETFSLDRAYPNPFNPTTTIDFSVAQAGYASVKVYNLMGQVVATLASGHMDASTYTLTWDASNASSGVYFVQAEAAGNVTTQKLMLMK